MTRRNMEKVESDKNSLYESSPYQKWVRRKKKSPALEKNEGRAKTRSFYPLDIN